MSKEENVNWLKIEWKIKIGHNLAPNNFPKIIFVKIDQLPHKQNGMAWCSIYVCPICKPLTQFSVLSCCLLNSFYDIFKLCILKQFIVVLINQNKVLSNKTI